MLGPTRFRAVAALLGTALVAGLLSAVPSAAAAAVPTAAAAVPTAAAAVPSAAVPPAAVAAVPTAAAAGMTTVTYRGVSVSVPAGWPILRLDGSAGCVRFDRHAVYLGDPATSTCPADIAGHTEAVHLTRGQVLDARSPRADVGAGRSQTGGTAIHPDLVVSHRRAPVRAVVTSGADPALARDVAGSVRFAAAARTGAPVQAVAPAPADRVAAPGARGFTAATTQAARTPAAAATTTQATAARTPAATAARARAGTTFTGLGFDTCLTPSLASMQAWAASPYRAVNMYVGGASRGCPNQPNLTSTWVTTVVAQGWTLIPTYVGLQAPCATRYPNRINPATAAAQGSASADDAINVINAIGLGAGSIVYFDIEAYDYTNASCLAAVRTFLDSWTARLHARNYLSGVYTSAIPMRATLVDKLTDPTFRQPDDIWFARWAGDNGTVFGDPSIPDTAWPDQQRIHQYRGGHQETWGGVTINIDNNRLDADTAPGAPLPEGTFVSKRGETATYRIAGGAALPVTSWAPFGGPQPVETVSATRFRLLPTYPRDGSFLQGSGGAVFRVQSGRASFVPSWDAFGGPQPTTLVDQAALDNAGAGGVFNHLRKSAPAVRLVTPPTGTAAASQRVEWVGAITAPAIRNYDLRYKRSRYNGTFQSWTYLAPWQNTTRTAVTKGLPAGWNYCFQVRATSRAGDTTGWSSTRCVSRALDDRSLVASAGWKRSKNAVFSGGTVTGTTKAGVRLSLANARVARVGLVATTCAVCGRVAIAVNGKRVGTVNLASPQTVRRAVLMLPHFSRRTGTVTVKTLTSGRRVQVDGLVAMRS